MSELLPCPFCGSPAALNFGNDGDVCNVRCSQWSVGTCLGAGPNSYHKEKAIEGWNRRAAVQAAQPAAVGWKLVPIEPTPEMLAAILEPIKWAGGKDAYKAMLASAPTEPMSAPTAEPTRWAMCTETETPCSTCPTAGIPCQAEARQRDIGDLILMLDRWKSAPPGDASTEALNNLQSVIDALATPPSAATPEPSDAERWREFRTGKALTVKCKKATVMFGPNPEADYPEALDAAIDAAIRATKGGNHG